MKKTGNLPLFRQDQRGRKLRYLQSTTFASTATLIFSSIMTGWSN